MAKVARFLSGVWLVIGKRKVVGGGLDPDTSVLDETEPACVPVCLAWPGPELGGGGFVRKQG